MVSVVEVTGDVCDISLIRSNIMNVTFKYVDSMSHPVWHRKGYSLCSARWLSHQSGRALAHGRPLALENVGQGVQGVESGLNTEEQLNEQTCEDITGGTDHTSRWKEP